MKKNFLIISIFICLFAFSISAYASDGRSTNYIKLNKSTVTMYITETTTIKATYSNSKGDVKKIVWKSSNKQIATVKNGVVTARKPGTVTITASSGDMKKNCRVTVRGAYLKGNYLTIQNGTSSENTCCVYTLKNGTLKKIGEYFHTTSSAYPVPVYKINGKSCSRETFFKSYDKYMKNAKSLI